jgi:hypothetical protein
MMRTRVNSARWIASSSAASSTERRRPFFGASPGVAALASVARIESSVARTDQSFARISSRSRAARRRWSTRAARAHGPS